MWKYPGQVKKKTTENCIVSPTATNEWKLGLCVYSFKDALGWMLFTWYQCYKSQAVICWQFMPWAGKGWGRWDEMCIELAGKRSPTELPLPLIAFDRNALVILVQIAFGPSLSSFFLSVSFLSPPFSHSLCLTLPTTCLLHAPILLFLPPLPSV